MIEFNYKLLKMEFKEQKTQIVALLKKGDRMEIAKNANVSIGTTRAMLLRNSIDEMSASELKAWASAIEFINAKLNSKDKVRRQTEKLLERM